MSSLESQPEHEGATGPKYAIHAYAWTTSWSNDDLHLIDHAAALGLDLVEIPLMEPEKVDPRAFKALVKAAVAQNSPPTRTKTVKAKPGASKDKPVRLLSKA